MEITSSILCPKIGIRINLYNMMQWFQFLFWNWQCNICKEFISINEICCIVTFLLLLATEKLKRFRVQSIRHICKYYKEVEHAIHCTKNMSNTNCCNRSTVAISLIYRHQYQNITVPKEVWYSYQSDPTFSIG